MLYIFLAIFSAFTLTIVIKINETAGANSHIVLASNYISAAALGWIFTGLSSIGTISHETLILGAIGGFLWPASFYLMMWGIRDYGMALAGTICRLSLVIPLLFAFLFLHEPLTGLHFMGLFAAFISLYLFNPVGLDRLKIIDKKAIWFFPLFIFIFGIVDLWVNIFNIMGPESEKFLFVTLVFTFSNIIAWAVVFLRKIKPDKSSVIRGLILGIPNFSATYFLLESLKSPEFSGKSAILYTFYSTGTLILAFLAGILIWKEKTDYCKIVGAVGAIIAIILLNQ